MAQTVLRYKTVLCAEQTDHVVCIFEPSVAPYFIFFTYFPFIVYSRIAQSHIAFLRICQHCLCRPV